MAAVQPTNLIAQSTTNVLLLYSYFKLFDTYRQEDVLNKIFVASFLTALSAFVSISSMINFPLFFIVLAILRPFSWREWMVAVVGFLSPVFIYECLAYLSDFNQWYFIKAGLNFIDYLEVPHFSEYYLPILLYLLVMAVVSIIGAMISGFGNTVKKQKAKTILLWYIFFNSVGFFSGGTNGSRVLLTFAFPLSFFIGDLLYWIRQVKITNTILVLLFACIVLIFLAEYNVI